MLIRKIKELDLLEISELFEEFGEGKAEIDLMRIIYNQYTENKDYFYLCAEEDGKIIGSLTGFICYSLFTEFSPFMVLENVIVRNKYRGQGIGKALILKIEEIASHKGCKEIMFVSGIHRKDAHQFL